MKTTIRILKTCCFTFLVTTLLFIIFLPFLCDTYLLPRLLEQLPYSHKEMSLSRISPWGLRGTLSLAQDDVFIASVPGFEVQYSPTSLSQGTIDTIILDTPTINLLTTNGAVSDRSQPETPGAIEQQTSFFPLELPVSINELVITNGHVVLQTASGIKNVSVDSHIRLDFDPGKQHKYKLSTITVESAIAGDLTLTATNKGIFNQQGTLFTTEVNIQNLTDISNFTPAGQDMTATGSAALKAEVTLDESMQVLHYLVDADLDSFESSLSQVSFSQTSAKTPINIQLEGNSRNLSYKLSGLALVEPERVDLEASGEIDLNDRTFTGVATVFSGRLDHLFAVSMSGSSHGTDNILADLQLAGDRFFINEDTSTGPVKITVNMQYENKQLTGRAKGKIATIELAAKELALQDITWNIPLQWPIKELQREKEGQFTIESVTYKKRDTATVSANLTPMSDGLSYNAELSSIMDMQGKISCSGSAFFNGAATATCSLVETTIDTQQLPDYIKLPRDTSFVGTISADAAFTVNDKKKAGQVKLHLSKGTFTSGETVISGIETKITLPDLPALRSEPGQLATITAIDYGKIHLEQGKIFFRLENTNQLFLEKARFSWCGGKIEMGSLTLASGMQSIEATIFCDRIGFAEILKQFGIEDTTGQGSLSGRLPIDISSEAIHFDDGFLFSTPGNTGTVRFNNTKQLRQGIGDIGQTATLDYSISALENFAYNWTKLSFNTEGDDLLLALQIDGKPAQPLPFGYKNGQITATDKGPGLQHPLRLDMNFRLPLQDLFNTGKAFNH